MTDKQDLIKQTEKLQQELDILKEKIEQCDKTEYIRWRANESESYYTVDPFGAIEQYMEGKNCKDEYLYSSGNYFSSIQEAEDYKENIITKQKLKDLALRLNKGVKIDWENGKQNKYSIFFNTSFQELDYNFVNTIKDIGNVYCLDEEFFNIAIKEIGKDKLIKLIESGV